MNGNNNAILPPFITGVGPGEIGTILNMFTFPNCKLYRKTIFYWQSLVCELIIDVSNREIQHAMAKKIKANNIIDTDDA